MLNVSGAVAEVGNCEEMLRQSLTCCSARTQAELRLSIGEALFAPAGAAG